MQYLIGEIGISLLIASLIGVLVGWFLRYFSHRNMLELKRSGWTREIRQRDEEIEHLRAELHHMKTTWRQVDDSRPGIGIAGSRGSGIGGARDAKDAISAGSESSIRASSARQSGAALTRTRKTETITASTNLSVAAPSAASNASNIARSKNTPRANKSAEPIDEKDLVRILAKKNQQVDALQKQIKNLVLNREKVGNRYSSQSALAARASDDETYAKLQAIAAVGETERKLKIAAKSTSADSSELIASRRRAEQQDSLIQNLRKQLETQQQRAQAMLHAQNKAASARSHGIDDKQISRLKSQAEDETYAKVQALAALGQAERQISATKSGNSDSIAGPPLHRPRINQNPDGITILPNCGQRSRRPVRAARKPRWIATGASLRRLNVLIRVASRISMPRLKRETKNTISSVCVLRSCAKTSVIEISRLNH